MQCHFRGSVTIAAGVSSRRDVMLVLAAFVLLCVAGSVVGPYPRYVLTLWMIYSLSALGLNLEQELTRELGVFARVGWNDGHSESWAFTEIDRNLLEFVSPRVMNGSVKLLVVLTKIDKLNRRECDKAVADAARIVAEAATDDTDFALATLSALSRVGVADVARFLDGCVHPPRAVIANSGDA